MECICGCGTRIPTKLTETNFVATRVALELLAWDRVRTLSRLPAGRETELEALIGRGATVYQDLLTVLHGGPEGDWLSVGEDWLGESNRARLPSMVGRGSLLSRPQLQLNDEDTARLDRKRPETTFSGREDSPDAVQRLEEDEEPIGRIRELQALHAEGALTDEEFAEAKARLIRRI